MNNQSAYYTFQFFSGWVDYLLNMISDSLRDHKINETENIWMMDCLHWSEQTLDGFVNTRRFRIDFSRIKSLLIPLHGTRRVL